MCNLRKKNKKDEEEEEKEEEDSGLEKKDPESLLVLKTSRIWSLSVLSSGK